MVATTGGFGYRRGVRRVLVLLLPVFVAVTSCSGDSTGGGPSSDDASDRCEFDVRTNPARAYEYGVPDGWVVVENDGGLLIAPDPSGKSAVVMYTALLDREQSSSWFLDAYMNSMATMFTSQGGTLEKGDTTGGDIESDVLFGATIGGVAVSGRGRAEIENRFATAAVSWSPDDGTGPDDATLEGVIGCFRRITEPDEAQLTTADAAAKTQNDPADDWGPLVERSDGNFVFRAPESWSSVANEAGEISSLQLVAPDDDAAVLFLFMLNRNQPSDGSLIDTLFRLLNIDASVSKSSYEVPSARVYDFEGTVVGRPGRGMVAVRVDTYTTTYVCYLSLIVSTPETWGSVSDTLARIASSAGLTDISGNLAALPPLPNYSMGDTMTGLTDSAAYRDSVRESASDAWSEAMLGYVTVESPSTGQRWRASVNSYNPSYGGYVRQLPGGGGVEVLEQK